MLEEVLESSIEIALFKERKMGIGTGTTGYFIFIVIHFSDHCDSPDMSL